MEKIMFPMKYLNITQGINGTLSHRGTNAIDTAGKDLNIDDVFAPCTIKCVYKDTEKNGNACFFESVDKVQFANGVEDHASFLFVHDNNINKIKIGAVYKQGQVILQEGTAGRATGNHSHIEVARGRIPKNANRFPYCLNNYGVYSLPNGMHPADAFFIDGCIIKNDFGYSWKKTTDKVTNWEYLENVNKYNYKKNGKYIINDWVFDNEYNAWYYFDEKGYMVRSKFVKFGDEMCYVLESGKMAKNETLTFKADNSGYLNKKTLP